MEIIREVQKKTKGFTEFIPLLFIPYGTTLGRKFGIKKPLSFERVLKFYALSRIYFHGLIPNIQSSWPKLGLENAVKCLSAGVNDLGGTLYEENITRTAGGNFGQKVSIEEFREQIIKAGKTPRLRDTLYHLLPDNDVIRLEVTA
jgi:2-iminoacetate synthase ThiH